MTEIKNIFSTINKILSINIRNFLIILCILSLPMLIIDHFIHSSFSIGFVLCLTLVCIKTIHDYNVIKKELKNEETGEQRQEATAIHGIKEN